MNIKIDALHQVIEQVGDQTAEILLGLKQLGGNAAVSSHADVSYGRQLHYSYQSRTVFESDMEHKDVLSDAGYIDSEAQGGEHSLTPEIQIQRLTAQLTAAYNRIAALEEQLIAKRIH